MATIKEAKAQPSYRELQERVDAILGELKNPDLDIERSMELYQQGQRLLQQMEQIISRLQTEVNPDLTTPDEKTID